METMGEACARSLATGDSIFQLKSDSISTQQTGAELFILRYIDDLTLRQAIERQLILPDPPQ